MIQRRVFFTFPTPFLSLYVFYSEKQRVESENGKWWKRYSARTKCVSFSFTTSTTYIIKAWSFHPLFDGIRANCKWILCRFPTLKKSFPLFQQHYWTLVDAGFKLYHNLCFFWISFSLYFSLGWSAVNCCLSVYKCGWYQLGEREKGNYGLPRDRLPRVLRWQWESF